QTLPFHRLGFHSSSSSSTLQRRLCFFMCLQKNVYFSTLNLPTLFISIFLASFNVFLLNLTMNVFLQ
ncbi:unnamed protein product, partial [Brassica rapa subsp. trilocularis]